ncbi:hypothetical protein [Bradyrhizobium canariense]|uniref:Uncharacterized protein n=1 Tax=Bradyrhizobium canariense TaxID=255045 RepID=A0A1H1MNA2_9BRAD|nr:hypothetical protein [Bradyrhizobium canariense]SDR88323.1 hypothetical protein SAMN05444158_0297 [Bradyrhizobium canariense]
MTGKKPGDLSPESIARANRQRVAAEEGVRAMAEVERQAVAVRKNMERLRVLRKAKEAEAVETELATGDTVANTKRKKRISKAAQPSDPK